MGVLIFNTFPRWSRYGTPTLRTSRSDHIGWRHFAASLNRSNSMLLKQLPKIALWKCQAWRNEFLDLRSSAPEITSRSIAIFTFSHSSKWVIILLLSIRWFCVYPHLHLKHKFFENQFLTTLTPPHKAKTCKV